MREEEFRSTWALRKKEVILNSFLLSNFNYCPFVWHFRSSKSLKKILKIQERELRRLYKDSTSDYNQLLNKSSKAFIEVKASQKPCAGNI